MNSRSTPILTMMIMLMSAIWQCTSAFCQDVEHSQTGTTAESAARRHIMESDRWRIAERHLNEWLSVQKLYSSEEVSAVKEELAARVAKMSPPELETFLHDMEDRLAVLTSPEADEARLWLGQFMSVARNPEEQLGMSRPDVMNMTAGQIRRELQRLQQVRDSRLQAQTAFNRTREVQTQLSRDVLAARQTAQTPTADRSRWPANTPSPRNQNTQRRDPLPPPFRPPVYTVSPWGTPVIWHP